MASGAAVKLSCPICIGGNRKVGKRFGKIVHRVNHVANRHAASLKRAH